MKVDHGTTGPNAGIVANYTYDHADNRTNVTVTTGGSGGGSTCSGVSFETTSLTAVKTNQLRREERIIRSGGNYIRDRESKELVRVCGVTVREMPSTHVKPVICRKARGLRNWINEKMDQDCTILDCGPAPGGANYPNPTSPNYTLELEELMQRAYQNYFKIPALGE